MNEEARRHLDALLDKRETGWRLNPRHVARVVQGRRMVQRPREEDAPIVRAIASSRGAEGIPSDVLMTLEALRQLGEQGNEVAARVYQAERKRLGIDRPVFSIGR